MQNIIVVAVGSIKERYWRQAIDEYTVRLKPFAKVVFREIPEEKLSAGNAGNIVDQEAEKLIKIIPQDSFLVVLERSGKGLGSIEFSRQLDEWSAFGKKVCFVIGGPLGLSKAVISRASAIISLSTMTFTHQMARVILVEQIYRVVMIQVGKKYHY